MCSCDRDGIRAEPVLLQLGSETTPITRCIRRHTPDWAFELAEQALVFKRRGILPRSGGWTEQPNTFVQAVRLIGWSEESSPMTEA